MFSPDAYRPHLPFGPLKHILIYHIFPQIDIVRFRFLLLRVRIHHDRSTNPYYHYSSLPSPCPKPLVIIITTNKVLLEVTTYTYPPLLQCNNKSQQ